MQGLRLAALLVDAVDFAGCAGDATLCATRQDRIARSMGTSRGHACEAVVQQRPPQPAERHEELLLNRGMVSGKRLGKTC